MPISNHGVQHRDNYPRPELAGTQTLCGRNDGRERTEDNLRSEDSNMNGAKMVLKDWHMSFIAIGGAIGSGIFLSIQPSLEAGPISLLATYFLVGATLWSTACCLGEMATLFPMEYPIMFIDDGWGEGLGRRLPKFWTSPIAAFFFLGRFFEERWFSYTIKLVWILPWLVLSPLLGRVSAKIFRTVNVYIQTFKRTFFGYLPVSRLSRSRSPAWQALFMSLLLGTSPVAATSLGTGMHQSAGMPHCSSIFEALYLESHKVAEVRPSFPLFSQTN
jgi:hypothetical protein